MSGFPDGVFRDLTHLVRDLGPDVFAREIDPDGIEVLLEGVHGGIEHAYRHTLYGWVWSAFWPLLGGPNRFYSTRDECVRGMAIAMVAHQTALLLEAADSRFSLPRL